MGPGPIPRLVASDKPTTQMRLDIEIATGCGGCRAAFEAKEPAGAKWWYDSLWREHPVLRFFEVGCVPWWRARR
jgi:hypothetical protein